MAVVTRETIELHEKSILAPHAVHSKNSRGRKHNEQPSPYRTIFQRDRDRILHAKAFRRLKHKTQVFPALEGDHYRDRLTHSLAVAQIARDVSRSLALNEDLAESIALAHDLGHTPFGHSGEDALNEMLQKHGMSFEHNEQSKRTVEEIENPYPQFTGLNLAFETIDGLIKHQSAYDQVEMKIRIHPSLEAQVVNLSDEIAYNCHDTDDGLRAGIIQYDDIKELALWQDAEKVLIEKYGELPPIERFHQLYANALMKLFIDDVTTQTDKNIHEQNITSLEDVYTCEHYLATFSKEMRIKNKELRTFLLQKFYLHERVQKKMEEGKKIIHSLFNHFIDNPKKLPQNDKDEEPISKIRDYIAGMTDNFAYNCYSSSLTPNT